MFKEFEWYMGSYRPKLTEHQKELNKKFLPNTEIKRRIESRQLDSDDEYEELKDNSLSFTGSKAEYERTE